MRILHLADRLSDRGGAYWHLRGVIEALRDGGHVVHLAVGEDAGGVAAACPTTVVPGLDSRTRAPAELGPLMAAFRPDVVHLHTILNPAVLEWAAREPSLMTVQDHLCFCPARGKWTADGRVCTEAMDRQTCAACFDDAAYFDRIFGLTAERLTALRRLNVVVLSSYMKRELSAAGVTPRRVAVIPPFVHDLDTEARPDGPPCILFVGRLTNSKGAWDAVDAWRMSGVDLPLVVAGTGPVRRGLEGSGAEVVGWMGRARLAALYRRARAVILPSRWQEPFGIVGLEALTMGVPVVAWDSGGVREWHPGEGLVPWGDVAGLARALKGAVGRSARPLPGFERGRLMALLRSAYEDVSRETRAVVAAAGIG